MTGLRDRARQFRELTRLFFNRFLDNDLICVDGDTRATLIGIVSLLMAPGVFLPMMEYLIFSSYPLGLQPWWVRDLAAIPDKLMHIAVSMTAIGLVTVFEWDAILPDRRDVAVLRPFPVGLLTIFAARITALAGLWLVFTLAVDGVAGVFFPVAVVQGGTLDILLWFIRCHALALVAANAFIFLAVIAVQGLLMTVLGWSRFRRFAPYAQFVLFSAILSLFFLSIGLAFRVNLHGEPGPLMQWLPAWWFLALDQVQLGWRLPLFDELATYVWPALAAAGLLAAAGYALSYRRCVSQAFEQQDSPAVAPGRLTALITSAANRFVVRRPAERAAFYFVLHTVTRSRKHRLLVAAWAAAGFALVFQGITAAVASGRGEWWRAVAGPLLPGPIVLPLFVITGLRYAFTVPSELRANWIFQASATSGPPEYLSGVRKAAMLVGLGPLFALLALLYIALWGWTTGAVHVFFGAVVAWLLLEAQLVGLEKLPFTCSYVPGKGNVKTCWTFYVIGYLVYVAALSWLGLKLLEQPERVVWLLAGAVAVRLAIEVYRRRKAAFGFVLAYDERPEPAVQTLQLQE